MSNYQIRSRGGRFKSANVSDLGLRAQQERNKIHIDAQKEQDTQLSIQDSQHLSGLKAVGTKEQANAFFIRDLETDKWKKQRDAIEHNQRIEENDLKAEADAWLQKYEFWKDIAPKAAKGFLSLGMSIANQISNRESNKVFKENQNIRDQYYSGRSFEQQANQIAYRDNWVTNIKKAIKEQNYKDLDVFVDIELSKSENLGNQLISEFNDSQELWIRTFKANLKPGDLKPDTAVPLYVNWMAEYIADAGVHPNTVAAQQLFKRATALGRQESNQLYRFQDAKLNTEKINSLWKAFKGSVDPQERSDNLNTFLIAIGTKSRIYNNKIVEVDPSLQLPDYLDIAIDYAIDNMKPGEFGTLKELKDSLFNTYTPPSTKGKDSTEFWNIKHSKRFDKFYEKFLEKNKRHSSNLQKDSLGRSAKAIASINLFTSDPSSKNYMDLNDYSADGGRMRFGVFLDSLPKGSTERNYAASKLSIDPNNHESAAFITKLQHFAKYDHAAFAHIYGGLGKTPRKNLKPLFDQVMYFVEGGGSVEKIEKRVTQLFRDLSKLSNSTSELDGSAKNAIPHVVNKVIELQMSKYDPNVRPSAIVQEAFKEATLDLIQGKGLYAPLDPSDTAPGSGETRVKYKYFMDIANPEYKKSGWGQKKVQNYLQESNISYKGLIDRIKLDNIVGEESLVRAAKDIDDGQGFTYPEEVLQIYRKFPNELPHKILNDIFKAKGFSQRAYLGIALPGLRAHLKAKGVSNAYVFKDENLLAMSKYYDAINQTRHLTDFPWYKKIPMRPELTAYYNNNNNDEAAAEELAQNQSMQEQIRTRRRLGLQSIRRV